MKIKDLYNKVFHSKRVNFMGVKRAGKSQLLETLCCPGIKAGKDSQAEYYPTFEIDFNVVGVDKKIFIHGGRDFGGELQIFRQQFAKMMRKGDSVIFVVDAEKFLNNVHNQYDGLDYRMSVLQRIDHINRHTPRKNINKFTVILTHADSFADRSVIVKQFQQIVNSEQLRTIAHWINRYYVVDATNKHEVFDMFYKILC